MGFVSVAINKTDKKLPDNGQFVFSFFSHGRCFVPQMWGLRKDRQDAGDEVPVFNATDSTSVFVGFVGHFIFGSGRNESRVGCVSLSFEGLDDDTLTGKRSSHFTTARLLVVRLE